MRRGCLSASLLVNDALAGLAKDLLDTHNDPHERAE
jgi:hypothetical protein